MRRSFFWRLSAAITVWKMHRAWSFEMPWSDCRRIAQSLYEREVAKPPSQRRNGVVAVHQEFKAMSEGFR